MLRPGASGSGMRITYHPCGQLCLLLAAVCRAGLRWRAAAAGSWCSRVSRGRLSGSLLRLACFQPGEFVSCNQRTRGAAAEAGHVWPGQTSSWREMSRRANGHAVSNCAGHRCFMLLPESISAHSVLHFRRNKGGCSAQVRIAEKHRGVAAQADWRQLQAGHGSCS